MKPYQFRNKQNMEELRTASPFTRAVQLAVEFCGDVRALWYHGAGFPTFLKIIGTLLLCLLVTMPLVYPIFIVAVTYVTWESLFLSWWFDEHSRFYPNHILKRVISTPWLNCHVSQASKVREVMTRGILLAHSLATSVDYLCVMQGLLDES